MLLKVTAASLNLKPPGPYPAPPRLVGPSEEERIALMNSKIQNQLGRFEFFSRAAKATYLYNEDTKLFWARFGDIPTMIDDLCPAFGTSDGVVIRFDLITSKGEALPVKSNGMLDHFVIGHKRPFIKRLEEHGIDFQFDWQPMLTFVNSLR